MKLQKLNLFDLKPDSGGNMAGSGGKGTPLLKKGSFAADLIYFDPGQGIPEHTHPGNHVLYCLSGTGTLVFNGECHRIAHGLIYLVPGAVPHAIETSEDDSPLSLLSIADQHIPVDSEDRSQF